MPKPHIAIPIPTSFDADYNNRSWPLYASAIEDCDGVPLQVPLDLVPAEVANLLADCQCILLPGSPADLNPEKYGAAKQPKTADPDSARERVDELLLQDAYNMRKPILGVCYGLQSLNVWCGGTLIQDLATDVDHCGGQSMPAIHSARISSGSALAGCFPAGADRAILGQINSSHHQSIDLPGDGLQVVARCIEDGVVEAVEGMRLGHFVLGVQWHPEKDFSTHAASRSIFRLAVESAKRWKERS